MRACAFVRVCVCVFVRVREREMATHSSQSCALRVMRSIVQCGEREGAQGVDGDEKEVREREKSGVEVHQNQGGSPNDPPRSHRKKKETPFGLEIRRPTRYTPSPLLPLSLERRAPAAEEGASGDEARPRPDGYPPPPSPTSLLFPPLLL